jgi:hypothetical protein
MPNYAEEKRWLRPSIMAFSENLPTYDSEDEAFVADFKYLTDDNRSPLSVGFERIEFKDRMINGRMRSYHVADKKIFTVSWDLIPSRSIDPDIKNLDFISEKFYQEQTLTNENFLSADEMLEWYEENTGEFYLILSYDKQHVFGNDYRKISALCDIVPVFFDEFSYSVETRGQYNDLWSVSMSLVQS